MLRDKIMNNAQVTAPFEVDFDILCCAVQAAKSHGFQGVATLRLHLENEFPGREPEIQAALTLWARRLNLAESS